MENLHMSRAGLFQCLSTLIFYFQHQCCGFLVHKGSDNAVHLLMREWGYLPSVFTGQRIQGPQPGVIALGGDDRFTPDDFSYISS